jgi:hypothetical protein
MVSVTCSLRHLGMVRALPESDTASGCVARVHDAGKLGLARLSRVHDAGELGLARL